MSYFFRKQKGVAFLVCALLLQMVPAWAQSGEVKIVAMDEAGKPLAAVTMEIKKAGAVVLTGSTDEKGEVGFTQILPGTYQLTATKAGFEPRVKNDLVIEAKTPLRLELLMVPQVNITDTVNVTATNSTANPIEQGPSVATDIQRTEAKDTALRPATVADALPLVPGVVRDAQGQLHIAGSSENRNALLVNSMDVTDPATGQFGLTIPIDSVQTLSVFKSPFLAQYGRFTGGVVSVETRRGGEKWNYELNDPFPEFRYLRGHLRGLQTATPRVTFNGPILKNKFYLSQGIEYTVAKKRVLSLPFPNNETINESVNSFTQLDYIGFAKHAISGTAHIAPRQASFFNLDYFNQRPVTPNFRGRDYTGTMIDRWTLGTNLLESTVAIKKANLGVWGQGEEEMFISPTGNYGNYFNQQHRDSSRTEWQELFSARPLTKFGTHNFKVGSDLTRTSNQGTFDARPINIVDTTGALLKRIEFVDARPYNRQDTEVTAFGQDHWVLAQNFSLDLGIRGERQSITGAERYAPRAGFAWTPFGNQRTVIRGGAGLFYDRVPLNVYAFSRFPDQVVTTYGPGGVILDGPRRFYNITDKAEESANPFIRGKNRINGNFAPYTSTWVIEAEHPINSHLRIRANFQKSNSYGLITVNPKVVDGQDAMVIGSGGKSRYQQFELTAKVSWKDNSHLFLSYVHSNSQGDLNEFNNYLGSFPYPIVRPNQYSNLPGDLPHRFLAWGVIKLPWEVTWLPMAEVRSGFPYALVDEKQNYVGVPNNDQYRFPTFFAFDSRMRKDFKINNKYTLRVSVTGFNLTNHFNPPSLHNNIDDPQFGLFFGQNKRRFRLDFDVLF